MSNIDNNYVDFLLNSLLKNNTTQHNISNVDMTSQSEQAEMFEQVFDDAIDMLDMDLTGEARNTKEENEKEEPSDFIKLLGNNFGPPAGLTIENFDYSLLQ